MDASTVHGGPLPEPDEEEGIRPLPDRLLAELTAHRTLALRHALGERPDEALLAALHALCLRVFYPYALDTCLELDLRQTAFTAQGLGLGETAVAKAIGVRHQGWAAALPREATDLWAALAASDGDTRLRLFAHCIGLSVNAVHDPYTRRPRALAHADVLAQAVDLDMAAAEWTPTVDSYLGRVTKARILQAVREAKGEHAAQLIDHLKKGEMAERAQELLAGSGWLPEPLRTPGYPTTGAGDADRVSAADIVASKADASGEAEPRPDNDDEAEGYDPEAEAAHAFAAE